MADCLAVIDGLAPVTGRIDGELRLHATADPRVKVLTTLPGVGQFTALVMLARPGCASPDQAFTRRVGAPARKRQAQIRQIGVQAGDRYRCHMAALVLVAVSLGLSNFAASVGIGVSGMTREPGCALG